MRWASLDATLPRPMPTHHLRTDIAGTCSPPSVHPQVAPLALLVEKAGGASSCDGLCVSGLDVEVKQHDQRTQVRRALLSGVRQQRPAPHMLAGCSSPHSPILRAASASVSVSPTPPALPIPTLSPHHPTHTHPLPPPRSATAPRARCAALRSTCTATPPASPRSPPKWAASQPQPAETTA